MGPRPLREEPLATEVVRAIRTEIGDAMPISFRFRNGSSRISRRVLDTPDELEQVLGPLAAAGVDISKRARGISNRAEFEGSDMNLAGWAKKVEAAGCRLAVGGIGIDKGFYDSMAGQRGRCATRSDSPARSLHARNEFDLVGVGRSLLHDPGLGSPRTSGEPFLGFSTESLTRLT